MINIYDRFKLKNPIKGWDGFPFPYSQTHRNVGVSQWFGGNPEMYAQFSLKGHNGIDIGFPKGTEVVFPIRLWVTFVSNSAKGYGKYLFGQTEEKFIDGTGYYLELVFAHFDEVVATPNKWYEIGELIGYGDSTGFSTGHHLHLGIRPYVRLNQTSFKQLNLNNGYLGYVDPEPYLPKLRWTLGELEKLKHMKQLVQKKGDKDVYVIHDNGEKYELYKITNASFLNKAQRLGWVTSWDKIQQVNSFQDLDRTSVIMDDEFALIKE